MAVCAKHPSITEAYTCIVRHAQQLNCIKSSKCKKKHGYCTFPSRMVETAAIIYNTSTISIEVVN